MKYALFHIIEGKEKVFLQELKNDVEEKFKLKPSDFKSFPHITIKYDFVAQDIKPVEIILNRICNDHGNFKLKISGIGRFDKNVIFLKVQDCKQLTSLYKNLCKELKKIDWISWEAYEAENYLPHFTVVYKQINDNNFTQILDYLKSKNIKLKINFNNLAITRIENKERKTHKLYRLA